MKIEFEVGTNEKHKIEFYYNPFWGNLYIKVDGNKVHTDLKLMSFELTEVYDFRIGLKEIHNVKIEKTRKLFFAGFRNQKYAVYIDGILVRQYEGY